MTYSEFIAGCENAKLSSQASTHERALFEDSVGNWEAAHDLTQDTPDQLGSAIHAYLHRKEGDQSNANYWYSRAGREPFSGSLQDEWLALVKETTD